MSTSVTFEDMESQAANAAVAAVPKAEDLKINASGLSEDMSGKSASEVDAQLKALKASLQLSEAGRLAAEANARSAATAAAAPAPVAAAPVDDGFRALTRDELKALHDEDPISAMAYVAEVGRRNTESNFERRYGTMAGRAIDREERSARDEYKLEFELFGDEIAQFKSQLKDKSVLASPTGWEQMMSYIRGKKGNFEKYFDARQKGQSAVAAAAARTAQGSEVGFVPSGQNSDVSSAATGKLDDIQKEIARNLGMTEADYITWSKVS